MLAILSLMVVLYFDRWSVSEIETGALRRLTLKAGRETFPALSPDGKMIAFVAGPSGMRNLFVRPVSGGRARRLTEGLFAKDWEWPQFSPDGTRIACVSGNRRFESFANNEPSSVWVVSLKDGGAIQLTNDKSLNMSPVWTPDSKNLLFVSDRDGRHDLYLLGVAKNGKPVGEPRRLTTGLDATKISISADGSQIVFSEASLRSNIWSLPIRQGNGGKAVAPKPVTRGAQVIESFDVSHDGQWLVFDSDLHGNQDIYRRRLPNGRIERLTTHPDGDFGPTWSPDGREIAFHSLRHGTRDIFVMDEDGSHLCRVTSSPSQERYPDWAPDGKTLFSLSYDGDGVREIFVLPVGGGEPWPVVELGALRE